VSNFAVFRCGDDEAKRMSQIYGLKPRDFNNLDQYQAWLRLDTDNILIETLKPIMKDAPSVDSVKTEPKVWFIKNAWIPC